MGDWELTDDSREQLRWFRRSERLNERLGYNQSQIDLLLARKSNFYLAFGIHPLARGIQSCVRVCVDSGWGDAWPSMGHWKSPPPRGSAARAFSDRSYVEQETWEAAHERAPRDAGDGTSCGPAQFGEWGPLHRKRARR